MSHKLVLVPLALLSALLLSAAALLAASLLTLSKAEAGPIPLNRITAYNAVAGQTDASPHISSCGPTLDNQIAVSQDLFFAGRAKHLCGKRATIVTADGREFEGVINDTMNRRYKSSADILFQNYGDAKQFGVSEGYLLINQ